MAGLARVLSVEGDQRRAVELAASALSEPDAEDAVRIDAALGLAWGKLYLREDLEQGARSAALAAELAERSGHRTLLANSLSARGVLEAALGRGQAEATFEAALAVHAVADPARVIRSPEFDRSLFLIWTDRCAEAADLLRSFHVAAVEVGEEGSIALTAAQRGLAEYGLGHWPEASALATEAYELALQTGERPQQALALSVRALVRASEGREAEARADAGHAMALAGNAGMAAARLHATWALGLLELSLERPAQVVGLLAPERERLLAGGVGEPGSMRFVPDEVEALIALGRPEEAEAVLGWLEEHARDLRRASALAAAARCRGLLAAAHGDAPAALAAFEQALAEEGPDPSAFERARTLLCLGAAQRRGRHKRAARETLEAARERFDDLGAARWSQRAAAELERIGGRGPATDALTPSERRIVELVAEGGSNKQIAAALFVTPKTVETHLSRIYAKLGVHSRTQLLSRLGKA
jgi:DNA-binding CsgD family transcriptional regulator